MDLSAFPWDSFFHSIDGKESISIKVIVLVKSERSLYFKFCSSFVYAHFFGTDYTAAARNQIISFEKRHRTKGASAQKWIFRLLLFDLCILFILVIL